MPTFTKQFEQTRTPEDISRKVEELYTALYNPRTGNRREHQYEFLNTKSIRISELNKLLTTKVNEESIEEHLSQGKQVYLANHEYILRIGSITFKDPIKYKGMQHLSRTEVQITDIKPKTPINERKLQHYKQREDKKPSYSIAINS